MRSKIDSNHSVIVKILRAMGASVRSTAMVRKGFPDIVVGYQGKTYLFEIKTEKGKLTEDEETFFQTWNGQRAVIKDAFEAMKILGIIGKGGSDE